MSLTERLHELARERGAAGTGVCGAEVFDAAREELHRRARDGSSAGLGFTYSDPDVATDVRRSLPWAESLFVVAYAYMPEAGSPRVGPASGRVARFATRDHYLGLEAILAAVAAELETAGLRAAWLRDDSRLVDRAAAVRAGVGWWGKNSMVLLPGFGPWVLLGSVVTDAPLEHTAPMKRGCGSCSACLPACPTEALVAPGVLDARRCLAHWLQAPGVIPVELRPAVGDRVYGCDDCIEACPPGARLLDEAAPTQGVDLIELLSLEDRDLLRRHRHFFVPGRKARYLRRNAIVALGNTVGAREEALLVLAGYAGHPDWLLRAHAVWALRRMGGRASEAVLAAARRTEDDERVLGEFAGAPAT